MPTAFEFFVARRYLRAKRKQAVISLITVISIIGVAAGTMALIIALSVTNGFRNTLQRNLLRASSHVSILEKDPGSGIENWKDVAAKLMRLPHVQRADATLYGYVLFSSPLRAQGGVIKGVDASPNAARGEILKNLKQGSFERLRTETSPPGVILGSRLAQDVGLRVNDVLTVISPQGETSPIGPRPSYTRFRVVGIFESGFFDLDSTWSFTSLPAVQRVLGVGDVVNSIELEVDDIYKASEIARSAAAAAGPAFAGISWMEQNQQLLNALRMDRAVTIITIGLIQLVAALNILITLVMMVMEKNRDIAILSSMGARREQIRNIFIFQGVLIGAVGTAAGLVLGYSLSYMANRYRWIRLSEEIYSMAFVPFDPRWVDGLWVAAAALLVSFVATLYPARSATRVSPVESLRYE